MSGTGVIVTLSPCDYDAVLFDLDGVVTPTASAHAAARKKLFDASIQRAGGAWNAEQTAIANGIEVTDRLERGWPVKVPVRETYGGSSYPIEGLRAFDRRPPEAHTGRAESRGLSWSAVDGSP